jgi:hypothetical protein
MDGGHFSPPASFECAQCLAIGLNPPPALMLQGLELHDGIHVSCTI